MHWSTSVKLKDRKNKIGNFIKKVSPAQGIVYGFALIILIGAILLSLPMSSRNGEYTNFINAIFTSTSAACVTGLIIVDTYNYFNIFGQLIIIGLIQIGGLGIITMATWISILIGRRVTYKERIFVQESLNQNEASGIVKLTKKVVAVTFIIESIGAVFLSFRFVPQYGIVKGIYMSFFHAISAFCNAGFDVLGNFQSLVPYGKDPLVCLTICVLIILGGLGFIVIQDVRAKWNFDRLMLHSKVAIIITIVLLVLGTLMFLLLEYSNNQTLGTLNWSDKVLASFFQSVTCRTAGFSTISQDGLTEESKLVSIILMFIGASPGSTGGGIKTVTFGVILFMVFSILQGKENTEIFKRTVPPRVVKKSIAIIFFSFFYILIIIILIMIFENRPLLNVAFEVFSAFGTVGLSTGMTPQLLDISKLLLILTMFIGRVGPLTLTFALAKKLEKKKMNYKYPEGKIMVG